MDELDPTPGTLMKDAIIQSGMRNGDIREQAPMLMRYVVVAEWMNTDGQRFLSKQSGDMGENALPPWDQKGLLFEILNGWDWFAEIHEGDEDEDE